MFCTTVSNSIFFVSLQIENDVRVYVRVLCFQIGIGAMVTMQNAR
jgi:hypothetical protein